MLRIYFFFILVFFTLNCFPSNIHLIKFVNYNIEDEGVLTHNYIQTIGISELRNDAEDLNSIKEKCLFRAETIAKEKMISLLLQIHFDLKDQQNVFQNSFLKNYPVPFSKLELIYWSSYFEPLLNHSRIKFQNINNLNCKLVFVLEKNNLFSEIQNFNPLDY